MPEPTHPGVALVAFATDYEPRLISTNLDQAKRLEARGLVVRSTIAPPSPAYEAVYAAIDREAVLSALREENELAVCDFCSQRPVTRSFPADSFVAGDPRLGSSLGPWAACSVCADLVARRDRAGLTERALDMIEREGVPHASMPLIRVHLTALHGAFFENQLEPKEGVALATAGTGGER